MRLHFLISRFYELTLSLHLLTMYRAFVAAGAACDSLNLSFIYITLQSNRYLLVENHYIHIFSTTDVQLL